jgi:hypothetical protein
MKKEKIEPMRAMRIEIHRGPSPKRKVTGFTVHHDMVPKATKSSAFMEDTSHSVPFGADQHEEMMDHIHDHTSAQLGASGDNAAMGKGQEAENEKDED